MDSFALRYPKSPIHVTERLRTEFQDEGQDMQLRHAARQQVRVGAAMLADYEAHYVANKAISQRIDARMEDLRQLPRRKKGELDGRAGDGAWSPEKSRLGS